MSELSERAKKLRSEIGARFSALVGAIIRSNVAEQEQLEAALVSVIEQALLAERRLAMEEAAKIVDDFAACSDEACLGCSTVNQAVEALRAAAEKESVPRGGD